MIAGSLRATHGAPLWAGVDQGFDGADLDAWDEPNDLPCAVWLSGEASASNYWSRISAQSRITLTISHVVGGCVCGWVGVWVCVCGCVGVCVCVCVWVGVWVAGWVLTSALQPPEPLPWNTEHSRGEVR